MKEILTHHKLIEQRLRVALKRTKDPETKKRIEGNEGLLLHMSYATWNGPGHFQKFAKKLEDAVKQGKSDEELLNIAKDNRTDTFTGHWAKATTKVNNLIDKAASSSIA